MADYTQTLWPLPLALPEQHGEGALHGPAGALEGQLRLRLGEAHTRQLR